MKEYTHPIATVDAVILTIKDEKLHVLLTKREKEPFKNQLSLPGGWIFTEEDEDLYHSIYRVIYQKTNVKTPYFEQLITIGSQNRDPRGWSISTSYISLIPWDIVKEAEAGRNVSDLTWLPIEMIYKENLAFDHLKIINIALERLRNKVNYSTLPVYLLPETFTKTELQKIYEDVLGSNLDKSAFRKKINDIDFLEETGEMKIGNHRPAKLYRLKPESLVYFRSNFKK